MDTAAVQRLSVKIYQLADDQLFRSARTDGSGWGWGWADFERDWMSATPLRNAYRCLPLTIINQTGWWIENPVGFTATWGGSSEPGGIAIEFDAAAATWQPWINSQFGEGILTWNTPFLFRTEPAGSRLLVTGPTNYFRRNAHPLTALIESDWMTMSFTMNYKIMTPHEPVRFEAGEPLFQVIPLLSNVCADLEQAEVRYQRLAEDPAMFEAYRDWSSGRSRFHEAKARQEVRPDDWQKDYFQGRDGSGRRASVEHRTKVRPPRVLLGPARPDTPTPVAAGPAEPSASRRPPRRRPPARRRPGSIGPGSPASSVDNHATPGDPAGRQAPADSVAARPASCPMGMGMGSGMAMDRPRIDAAGPDRHPAGSTVAAGSHRGDEGTPIRRSMHLARPGVATLARDRAPARAAAAVVAAAPVGPGLDDNHRRWIAANLMLEAPPEAILDALLKLGIGQEEAVREINLALTSPYFGGADQLRNRLKKRDWMLATYRRINRLGPEATVIPRRHRLPRDQFLAEYYSTNRPVIITGMMDDWPALKKWDLDFFERNFGDREIEVQFGRNSGDNYEIEQQKFLRKIRFADFIAQVRGAGLTNDFYLTANNNSSNKAVLPELWGDIVQVPEYLDGADPMSGFFWMGPGGTVTPFHHDLTNNFMAQVIGRKKVKIAPSWDMPLMRNDFHVFSRVDGRVTPPQPEPALDQPQIVECILSPGEILFLPIGCLHYVEGLDVSVTVSFTNFVFPNDFASFYTTYHQV